jgi:hypothetical protein
MGAGDSPVGTASELGTAAGQAIAVEADGRLLLLKCQRFTSGDQLTCHEARWIDPQKRKIVIGDAL